MSARRHPTQAKANQRVRPRGGPFSPVGRTDGLGHPRRGLGNPDCSGGAAGTTRRSPGHHTRMAAMSRFPASAVLAAGLAAGLAATTAAAQDTDTPTVNVGDPAPDFELKDAHGASYRLSELLKRGPVVLEFFRSGGW